MYCGIEFHALMIYIQLVISDCSSAAGPTSTPH